jgi:uncharacterized membrane protein
MPNSVLSLGARSAAPAVARQAMDYIPSIRRNVGETERMISVGLGGCLLTYGLTGKRVEPISLLASAFLLYRGLSGNCPLTQAVSSVRHSEENESVIPATEGVRIEESITIKRPAMMLYRFWRNFSQLPRFMSHLREVREEGDRSHWVAKGPLGMSIEWDAELLNATPHELIAWRSLPGSDIDTAGSVHFRPAGNRGTEVRVNLKYDPPAGKLGSAVAKLFGVDPTRQIRDDLNRFKHFMETGKFPTVINA